MTASKYLKSGDSISSTTSLPQMSTNPHPTHKSTQPPNYDSHGNGLGHYEVLHKVHTIKIRIHHCNDKIVFVSD